MMQDSAICPVEMLCQVQDLKKHDLRDNSTPPHNHLAVTSCQTTGMNDSDEGIYDNAKASFLAEEISESSNIPIPNDGTPRASGQTSMHWRPLPFSPARNNTQSTTSSVNHDLENMGLKHEQTIPAILFSGKGIHLGCRRQLTLYIYGWNIYTLWKISETKRLFGRY